MKIRFVRDFQSKHTNEVWYPRGAEVDLPDGAAIVAEGAAEPIPDEPPPPAPEPPAPSVPKSRRLP